MHVLAEIRGVLLAVLTIISVGTIIGTFLVYKYKIKTNCAELKDVKETVKTIELAIPKFITGGGLELHCEKFQAKCMQSQERRNMEIKTQLEKTEVVILGRLEKMDEERNQARNEESKERVIRVKAWTQLATHVESLTARVDKLEGNHG